MAIDPLELTRVETAKPSTSSLVLQKTQNNGELPASAVNQEKLEEIASRLMSEITKSCAQVLAASNFASGALESSSRDDDFLKNVINLQAGALITVH